MISGKGRFIHVKMSAAPFLTQAKTNKSARRSNPFHIPDRIGMFLAREEQILETKDQKQRIMKLSLIERANELKPVVSLRPYMVSSVTRKASSRKEPEVPLNRREQRSQRLADFIQQKREVFILQLLMDKKNKEASNLSQEMVRSEHNYEEQEEKISDTTIEYKNRTIQIETTLARARKAAEISTRKRVEVNKLFKMKTTQVALLKSEISRNEELLEQCREYKGFMLMMTPPDAKTLEYFSHPKVLEEELEKIEASNLFLSKQCQDFYARVSETKEKYDSTLSSLEQQETDLESRLKLLPDEKDNEEKVNEKDIEMYESEIARLGELVQKVYRKCYGEEGGATTLVLLEQIEASLERLYKEITHLNPDYLRIKTAAREKLRREMQRRANQEEKEKLQQEKKELSLLRSAKVVKKREGRPLMHRTRPIRADKKDNAKKLRLLAEQQKIEKLLFGPALE